METFFLIIKLLASLGFVIFLFLLTTRYGGDKLKSFQNGKYIRVIDKTALNKDVCLEVVKIGEEAFVLSVTNSKVEIIKEIKVEDIEKIELKQKSMQYSYNDAKNFIGKLNIKGRIKYEKK